MLSSFYVIIALALIYPVYRLWNSLRYRLQARNAGCSLPSKYRHNDPILGLDLFLKRVESMKVGDTLALDQSLFDTYGKTVQTNVWGTKQYVTMDAKNIQTICATQVDKFGSAPMNNAPCKPFLGDGIITVDGAHWKHSRNLINPIFARAQIAELSTFGGHVRRMIEKIPKDGSTVDMQPLLKMLFLDSNTEFIFGESANSLAPETSSVIARRLPAIFDDALKGMRKRFVLGKLSFLAGSDKEWLGKCAEVHEIIDSFIEEEIRVQQLAKRDEKSKKLKPEGIPYSYVLLKELVRETDDKIFIRNELMNVFFPARDTTAAMTGNILFLLARHPEVWKTLRSEVLAIGEQELTFELLKSMKYMNAVMSEGKLFIRCPQRMALN
jgi:cytochrome P450